MSMEYVIIGNGVAGTEAAKNIRKRDSTAEIKIFTNEYFPFYSRIMLPMLLAKEATLEEIYVYKTEWYWKNKIQLYLNCTVKDIDHKNQTITLNDASHFTYNKLLFATGSSSNLPPVEGINTTEGVFTLRTIEDVMTITRRAAGSKTVTLIGGGLLGLEAGNSLSKLGLSVTIVEIFDRLLPRQLDAEGAAILQKQIEERGLKFLLSAKSQSIKDKGRTKILELNNGKTVEGDFIVVSAGIKPNIGLAKTIGISVDKGILVNDRMETNISHIYAAGDVAEHKSRIYGIWPAAQRQGVVAGINMADGNEVYTGTVPSTTLKVAGISLTSMGDILTEDKTVEHIKAKDPGKNIYKKLFIKEGKILGAIFLGDVKNALDIGNLMEKKTDVSNYKEKILDTNFDIKGLLK